MIFEQKNEMFCLQQILIKLYINIGIYINEIP